MAFQEWGVEFKSTRTHTKQINTPSPQSNPKENKQDKKKQTKGKPNSKKTNRQTKASTKFTKKAEKKLSKIKQSRAKQKTTIVTLHIFSFILCSLSSSMLLY